MEDWWQIVFEQFQTPYDCLRLGLTCKGSLKHLQRMEQTIRNFFDNDRKVKDIIELYHCTYIQINTFKSMTVIADFILHTDVIKTPMEPQLKLDIEYHYYGFYHQYMRKDLQAAKRYYMKAVELGYGQAMSNLSIIFSSEDNKKEQKKYLRMAVERGVVYSMAMLGNYYKCKFKFDRMEMYYLMSIKNGYYNNSLLHSLGTWYLNVGNYDAALKTFEHMPEYFSEQIADIKSKLTRYSHL